MTSLVGGIPQSFMGVVHVHTIFEACLDSYMLPIK